MLTLAQLAEAINQLPRGFLDVEVRLVTGIQEVERGPMEGSAEMTSAGVVSICIGKQGMFLFLDHEKVRERREPLPPLPPNFVTGDRDFDERRRSLFGDEDCDHGEDWKKG